MRISKRALTAAVLLSCACLMAPYYAHAEEIRTIGGNDQTITVTIPITEDSTSGTGLLLKGNNNIITIDADITSSGAKGIGLFVESGSENNITLNAGKTI